MAESGTLTATITPSSLSNKTVHWESSDSGVATVEFDTTTGELVGDKLKSTNTVKAISSGTTIITAKLDADTSKWDECKVTVGGGEGVLRVVPESIVIQLYDNTKLQNGIWYDGPLGIEGIYLDDMDITDNTKYEFRWNYTMFTPKNGYQQPNGHYIGGLLFTSDGWSPTLKIYDPSWIASLNQLMTLEVVNNPQDSANPPFGPYICMIPIVAIPFGTQVINPG